MLISEDETTPGNPAEEQSSTSEPSTDDQDLEDQDESDDEDDSGTDEDTDAGADESDAEEEISEADKVRHAMSKDIGKLRIGKRETEQKLQQALAELETYRQADQKLVRPNPDDFDDPEAYGKAVGRYEAAMEHQQEKREAARKAAAKAQEDAANATREAFEANEAKFSKTKPDYDAVSGRFETAYAAAEEGPGKSTLAQYLLHEEDGPAVGYYLGKNPKILDQIANLNHVGAMRELVKISTLIAAAPVPAPKKPAAPPPKPLGGRSVPKTDRDKMTTDEWLANRRKELNANKR